MNQTARDFLIGLCSIVALVGLGVLLMRFGEINTTRRYTVTIPTVQASGLLTGSTVTFNGVKVGIIESIEPSDNPQWPVTIEVGIDANRVLPSNALPFSNSSLLGTGASLALVVEPSDVAAIPLAPDAMFLNPVPTIDLARTTDVVVPSPATSADLCAASFTNCAPKFSKGSFRLMTLATVTPSLVT